MLVGSHEIPDDRIRSDTGTMGCLKCTQPASPAEMGGVTLKLFHCPRCKGYWLEHNPGFLPEDTVNLVGHLQHMELQAKALCARSITRAIAKERAEKEEAKKEEAKRKAKAEDDQAEAAKRADARKREARRANLASVL
jgi:hypothetical protein